MKDARRDAMMLAKGIRVVRFADVDILKTPAAVAQTILRELTVWRESQMDKKNTNKPLRPPPQPSPGVPEEGAQSAPAAGSAATQELFAALLASDLASEVQWEFNGHLSHGFDISAATRHVFARFRIALSSANDGPVVLLALAALQMKEGRVQAVIRDAAIDLIESGEAQAAFPAGTFDLRKSRENLLDQFVLELREARVEPEDGDGD